MLIKIFSLFPHLKKEQKKKRLALTIQIQKEQKKKRLALTIQIHLQAEM